MAPILSSQSVNGNEWSLAERILQRRRQTVSSPSPILMGGPATCHN